jgi:hypothetical protein
MTRKTMAATGKLKVGISAIEGLRIVGKPAMSVFSFTSDSVDIYSIGQGMRQRGWYLDSIMAPRALHLIITCQNLNHIDEFLADLKIVAGEVKSKQIEQEPSGFGQRIAIRLLNVFPGMMARAMGISAARSAYKTGNDSGSREAVFYGITASAGDKTNLNRLVLAYLDRIYSSRRVPDR